MKSYKIESGVQLPTSHFQTLIHIDCYRLKSGKEMEAIGWHDIVSNPKNLILIEWPERIAEILPPDHLKISFDFVDEMTRKIIML